MKIFKLLSLFALLGVNILQAQTKAEAVSAINKQEYRKAIEILNKVLAVNAKDAEAHYLLGKAFYENEDFTSAQASYTKGVSANTKYALNYVGLGRVSQKNENIPDAKKNYDKALELTQSNNVEVLVQVADAYLEKGAKEDIDEAEKLLVKAKILDPKNVTVYIALGDLYLKQKVYELALSNYRKATELDQTYLTGYLRVGQLYVKDQKYNEGATAFREALQQDSLFAPAYRELGELYYRAEKYEEAKNNLQKFVRLTGNDVGARARYASFLYLSQDYAGALTEIEKVLKDTTTFVMLRIKGYSLYKTNLNDTARKVMDQYFKMIPEKYTLAEDFENYAKILEKLHEDSLAIGYYRKAIAKDKAKAGLISDIALNYIRQKKYPEAIAEYKVIVAQKPNSLRNQYDLGKAYYFNKEYEPALACFNEMKKIEPEVHLGYLWAGNALAKTEDQENPEGKAKEDFQKVTELLIKLNQTERYKKDYITANSYLAAFYYLTGNYEEAKKNCEAVLTLDENHEQCKAIMDFLAKNKKP
jgi:tetratricopeptide (TPR) repeat protein